MTRLPVLPVTVLVTAAAIGGVAAQSPPPEVQTAGGVHTTTFRTPQGSVSVAVAADAAPGDTISGVVLATPAGSAPQERESNLSELNGLVVEWQNERTPVAGRRYQWIVPAALRTGSATVILRTRDGLEVSRAAVPIDGVPAPVVPQPSGGDAFELPISVQGGQLAVVRGPVGGTFAGTTVRVGDVEADLVASSPRRLVFRVPDGPVGEVPMQLTSGPSVVRGTMRVLTVGLSATSLQLLRGQRATMTARVGGLLNIAEPVRMTLRNLSSDVVRVQDGDVQTITIAPRQVQPDGSVTLTRGLTGVRAGAFQVTATVGPRPLALFDVPRAADRALAVWEAATGVGIAPAARGLIQRSLLDASGPLEQFLAQQASNRGDVRDLFAALLSHYCFDLRDGKPRAAADREVPRVRIRFVTFAQGPAQTGGVEIDAEDVRRLSFREFLTRLVQGLSRSQPVVGYLFLSSVPANAAITIDGQRKSEMTNRRFVTSIGEHTVTIAGAPRTCRQRIQVRAFQVTVVACEP